MVDPARIIKLSSPVIGLLAEVSVSRGDKVSRDQVIARLDSAVEVRNTALKRAQARATAAIEVRKERLALSRKSLERASRLANDAALTRQRIDELESEVRVNERELAMARFQRQLAKLELDRTEAILEQRTIRSPMDGVIIERVLSPGEFVDNDSHIVRLARLDPLFVETFLPVELYNKVRKGMTAIIEPEAPVGGRHEAIVTTIDRVFDSASGTFGVRLELPNNDERLPAGLRCRVAFAFE
ncbi:MAG: efflux RND transporter periplasmic adaptor subunit [bacterium]|nr:efflux RND transporter periplasmic adaptor subunit [bacterium]